MTDAHKDTTHVMPDVDIRYDREFGTGDPSRTYDNPRYDTVNDGGPDTLRRDRGTTREDDTFITEVFYAKQLRLETSLMSVTVPWGGGEMFRISKVNRGITEASILVHDDYGLEPIQDTRSMIFGSSSVAAGFTVLTDYRNNAIDAASIYQWKMGQAMDAIVRHMQRHMVGLYLSQDRVTYHAMEENMRSGHTGGLPGSPKEFFETFENGGFNVVRKSRWAVKLQQFRDRIMKEYNVNNTVQGGVNNGARSCSFFITPEIVYEAQENEEQLYVLFAGDLEPAGQVATTVASWEYAGAPGCMYIKISPARYRSTNINWLESYVMRPQHTFFPITGSVYKNHNIRIPDFTVDANRPTEARYYEVEYSTAVDHVMGIDNKVNAAKKKSFEDWFDTGMTRKFMRNGEQVGWTDFGEFLRASEGRKDVQATLADRGPAPMPTTATKGSAMKLYDAGSPVLWQDRFIVAWNAQCVTTKDTKNNEYTPMEKKIEKLDIVNPGVTAICAYLHDLAKRQTDGLYVIKYLKKIPCARRSGYLYEICEILRLLELPLPFGICLRRTRVLKEHMVLMIDNYAAYHQEDVMDTSIRKDPKTGWVSANMTMKYRDYIPESKGILHVEGAYPIAGKHLNCGTKSSFSGRFEKYREFGVGEAGQVSAGTRAELNNKSGHWVHPVMLIEAFRGNDIEMMSTIGYDDPMFASIYGKDNVLLSTKPDERYLSTSDEAAKRLGILDGFVARLRNHTYFLEPAKNTVKLKMYSWLMETLVIEVLPDGTRVWKERCAEKGPSADRVWIYTRDSPAVARITGDAVGRGIRDALSGAGKISF